MVRITYTKELLETAVARNVSMFGVLRDIGLKPGGGSQMVLSKRIKDYGIDISHFKSQKKYVFTVENREAINLRIRNRRREPGKRARFVFSDAKSRDRKNRRKFELTMEFVVETLRSPCSYCGDDSNLMTLDRKDNSIGYTNSNCMASCIRCNLIRRDMPLVAWTELSGSLKRARELGLFGDWLHKGR